MKEFILILLISLSFFVHGECQITYSKYLDINRNTQIGAKIHIIDDFAYISFLSGCTDVQVCSGVFKIDPDDIDAGPIWLDTTLNFQITTKCAASEDRVFITGRYVDNWPINQAVIRSYNLPGDTIQDFYFGPNVGDEFPGAIATGNDRIYFHYSQDTNPDTINILTLNKNLVLRAIGCQHLYRKGHFRQNRIL